MSYDIYLLDPVTHNHILLDSPHHMDGGTCAIGGTREAWLNITYNYSDWYYAAGVFCDSRKDSKGIRTIYDMTGAESIPVLNKAISFISNTDNLKQLDLTELQIYDMLNHNVSGYWIPSRENALRPLHQLRALAMMRPDGIWDGD